MSEFWCIMNSMSETGAQPQPRTKVLKNGAVYDLDKGRIVANPGGGTHAITSANAGAMLQKRIEKKRNAIARAANAVLAEGSKWEGKGFDFVEAIAEAQMVKATNPDDPKATDAARFLITEAGLSDKQADIQVTQRNNSGQPDVVMLIAALVQAVPLVQADDSDIVDAE